MPTAPRPALARRRKTVTLTAVATRTGEYPYLPEIAGGTVYGYASDVVEVSARVVGGVGMRLVLLRDGSPVRTTPIVTNPQSVTLPQPIGAGGYVRAEMRGEPYVDPNPRASRQDMEALTNPVFLVADPQPTNTEPWQASPTHGGTA